MSAEANWEADVCESADSFLCVGFCLSAQRAEFIFVQVCLCMCAFSCVGVYLAQDSYREREKKAGRPWGGHRLHALEMVSIL